MLHSVNRGGENLLYPSSQVRKLRHREVKSPAHSNTVKPRAGCQVSSGSKSIGRVLTKAGGTMIVWGC